MISGAAAAIAAATTTTLAAVQDAATTIAVQATAYTLRASMLIAFCNDLVLQRATHLLCNMFYKSGCRNAIYSDAAVLVMKSTVMCNNKLTGFVYPRLSPRHMTNYSNYCNALRKCYIMSWQCFWYVMKQLNMTYIIRQRRRSRSIIIIIIG